MLPRWIWNLSEITRSNSPTLLRDPPPQNHMGVFLTSPSSSSDTGPLTLYLASVTHTPSTPSSYVHVVHPAYVAITYPACRCKATRHFPPSDSGIRIQQELRARNPSQLSTSSRDVTRPESRLPLSPAGAKVGHDFHPTKQANLKYRLISCGGRRKVARMW